MVSAKARAKEEEGGKTSKSISFREDEGGDDSIPDIIKNIQSEDGDSDEPLMFDMDEGGKSPTFKMPTPHDNFLAMSFKPTEM